MDNMGEKLEKDQKVFDKGLKEFWWRIERVLMKDKRIIGRRLKWFWKKIQEIWGEDKGCIGGK